MYLGWCWNLKILFLYVIMQIKLLCACTLSQKCYALAVTNPITFVPVLFVVLDGYHWLKRRNKQTLCILGVELETKINCGLHTCAAPHAILHWMHRCIIKTSLRSLVNLLFSLYPQIRHRIVTFVWYLSWEKESILKERGIFNTLTSHLSFVLFLREKNCQFPFHPFPFPFKQ